MLGSVSQEIQCIPAFPGAISTHSCGPGLINRRSNELGAAKKIKLRHSSTSGVGQPLIPFLH